MLYKRSRKTNAHWWVRFEVKGVEIRQSSGTDRKELAEAFEQSLREAIWREQNLGEEDHTWEEACQRWLKEKAHKRSLERDRQAFARLRLSGDIRDFIPDSHGIGARELAVYRSILNACVTWGWLDRAPKVEMPHEEKSEPRWITKTEFKGLLAELPPHAAQLARFAVATGLRQANIFRLKWSRVDLDQKKLTVAPADAKAGRGIGIPLSGDAVRVLKEQSGRHPEYCFTDHRDRAPVRSIKTAWLKAVARAGIPSFRFHDLRHTWAAWHTLSGTPAIILKELGGWRSLAMVERYSALNPMHLAAWADNSRTKTGTHRKAKKVKSRRKKPRRR